MNKVKSIILWIAAVVLMAAIAVYQRATGPTYPVGGQAIVADEIIKYDLPRSHSGSGDEIVKIETKNRDISGIFSYRRYKSRDEWHSVEMERVGDALIAKIPHQPPAGKVMYEIDLVLNGEKTPLSLEPVIIRFTGAVPDYFLLPHIAFMFLAMCLSMRTGFEAIFKGKNTIKYSIITTILLFLGGIVLGPIVQKYAFGAFWTGWPLGHDLTDNKTAVAFIAWLVAIWRLKNNPDSRFWPLLASLILLAVYLIPHSVLGSEIDYTKTPNP